MDQMSLPLTLHHGIPEFSKYQDERNSQKIERHTLNAQEFAILVVCFENSFFFFDGY
jgi:hypothetical protein